VIPIEKSLLYVRPLYLQTSEGRIPELKRVIVAYQTRIEMAETLKEALMKIFGRSIDAALPVDRLESTATSVVPITSGVAGAPGAAGVTAEPGSAELIAEAGDHYDRMQKAARDGDWALYGEEQKKLGETIKKLQKIKK
jgi:uncharacterized membrane protein (UPF0182 family)